MASPTTNIAPATTVEKIGNRFVVSGVIAVIAARRVDEEYSRVFRTKTEAERAAARLDQQNAEALAYLAERRAARLEDAAAYLTRRAARPVSTQLNLF